MPEADLLSNIGLAIVVATGFALVAKAVRQPLLLAYLAAGILLGPKMGFSLITDEASITLISEIGLILLLFIIGLEIDLKKLISSGRTLIVSGISQFIISVSLGIGFFILLGFQIGGGRFDALYLAVAMALSSTMIVVKILYDKSELSTQPGRITLGILIFQDIWAILFLSLQPNLQNPAVSAILLSIIKGAGLVMFSFLLSRYLLLRVFSFIAKVPELMLLAAIAWCFLIAGVAGALGLSKEMGALVAGVSLSTFPYNVDVIAKVLNIRDFFVTLFFVGLGLQIPVPTVSLIMYAGAASLFLVATRFVSIFAVLYLMKTGLRTSLIPSINLSQMSEFSLVIAALGLGLNHIGAEVVGILTFVFAITSVLSTYLIQYNHEIQMRLSPALRRIGMRDIGLQSSEAEETEQPKDIVFLGFFREASSILHEIESLDAAGKSLLMEKIMVVDFNPEVHAELNRRGIRCLYGDISSLDTLKHAHVDRAKTVVCTVPDSILRGTTNERLLSLAKRICSRAQVIVTAGKIQAALDLYEKGADFVFVPRIHSSGFVAGLIGESLSRSLDLYRQNEIEDLKKRREVID